MSPFDFYDYPISHSLLTAAGWGLLVAGAYYAIRRNWADAIVLGLTVLSHWVLDLVVHRPDLPLWPGGPRLGLGLWNYWVPEIVVEVAIFAAGIWLYLCVTRARDRIGRYAFWALIALLFFGWVSTLSSAPPPDTRSMAWFALSMWVLVPWAWWADRHRELVT